MKKGLYLLLLTFVTQSCINEDDPFKNLTEEDRDIVEKAYSKTYSYPVGFNYQKNLEGALYYENTISTRTSQTSSVHLSTNDKLQAKQWSETSSLTSAYYRDIVAETETEKFFEFKRVYALNKRDVILSRIHKSSYFIPSLDYFHPNNIIGTLKVNSVNEESTKEFIEYMWTIEMVGFNDKVLENIITDYPDKVGYKLKSVKINYGDFGLCDIVEVNNYDFFIDKQSGTVTFDSTKIKEIKVTCR